MFEQLWRKYSGNQLAMDLAHLKKEYTTEDHTMPLEKLYAKLNTSYNTGLSSSVAARRLEENGPNRLTPPPTIPKWVKFCEHLFEGFAAMLWCGAILCMAAYMIDSLPDNLYLGCVLAFVVSISGLFSYMQEAKSMEIMESFHKMIPSSSVVIRDGLKTTIPAEKLVVGDIVEVTGGDRVPGDIRVIESRSCKVDNSSLTGESEPQSRNASSSNPTFNESRNVMFFSTNCVEGWAKGVIIGTGDNTSMGRIASLTANIEDETSPISCEISNFIQIITYVAFTIGTVFFIIACSVGTSLIESIVFFISIIVANVPEGLLATVTVCLTLTARTMAKKNCLVKNLHAVETLGSTSTIASDKTGTLTQNRMTVWHLWVSDTFYQALQVKPVTLASSQKPKSALDTACLVCCLCSNATFKPDQDHLPINRRETIGDASESAILKFMESILDNSQVTTIRDVNPKVCEIPFNSSNKFHLTIHQVRLPQGNFILCMKGAPERIIERCQSYLLEEAVHPLDGGFKKKFEAAYAELGGMGERVLGLCYMVLPKEQYPLGYTFDPDASNFPLTGFQFLGLISMVDPPKPGVRAAVTKCRAAGIRVAMVTGDHPITALAIAKKVNIVSANAETDDGSEERKGSTLFMGPDSKTNLAGITSSATSMSSSQSETSTTSMAPKKEMARHKGRAAVVTGTRIAEIGDAGLDRIVREYEEIVFARTSPQQKLLIVEAFQRTGAIVAVTGDGVNDSPALRKANIGISMGISGSDVSKQTADLVLLDDNFASIVVGIEEGRIIFDNLKKSIAYTLTSNIPEITPFLLHIVFGIPQPLGTISILCIDIITDLVPAISLAYEPAENDIMNRKPRTDKDRLVNSRLMHMCYGQIGPIQGGAGLVAYIIIMAQNGFTISLLNGSRRYWYDRSFNEFVDAYGQEWHYGARRRLEFTCQTAFFVSIVVTQWFDVIISKTRRNSLLVQGMRNEVLNFALIFETSAAIFLCYCPGMVTLLKLYPLYFSWWLFGLPFGFALFSYDEFRRYMIRTYPGGYFERETFW